MTESNSQVNQSLDPNSPLYHSLDLLKTGHSMLTGAMMKTPAGAAIAITNDAILNIGISATAQDKSLGKSTVEFIGGFAAGTVCTISGGFLSGPFAAAGCGYIGSELSGRLYDEIAKANNYDNFEDFRQDYYQNNTAPTFEETLARYKVLETLQDGDYAYVNSPLHGGKLFTKVNGELHEVEGPIPQPDTSVIDSFNVDSSEVQVNTGDQGNLNVKVDQNTGNVSVTTDQPLNNEQKSNIVNNSVNNSLSFTGATYQIQSGDTLSLISLRSGVSVEKLLELNPQITDPNLIIAGEDLVLREAQSSSKVTINDESYQVSNGDKSILLANSGMVATDAIYIDSEGNAISVEDAFYTTIDSEGNTVTILKEGVKSQAKDGSSYEVSSLVNQVESGLEKATKFMVDSTVQFTSDFQDYLVKHQGEIVGDFVARIILGESAEEAMIAVAEVWGVNALLGNQTVDSALTDILGNLSDNPELVGGAKAGVVYFLSTVLISELRGDSMNSAEYTEAGVKAAAVGAVSYFMPGIPVSAIIAITDSAITAVENHDDLNSNGWQDLGTSTAAAVGSAVAGIVVGGVVSGLVMGTQIGAAIGSVVPGLGTAIGAVVGAIVGAILYVPLKNLFDNGSDAIEELYDSIEDTIIKVDWSGDNIEENAKQAVKAIEDLAKAYFIDLPVDILVSALNLFTGGSFYSGQTYGAGEAGSPAELLNQLYQVVQKADGSGLEIFGVGREGVTLKASQNGVDDIYGSAHSDVMVGNDQDNIIIGSSSSENGADNDMIEGKGGNDILLGKEGHDHIDGGDGNDQIDGGIGNDRLIGGAGDDSIIGDEGDDVIEGNDGNDQIDSGSGDDIVDGGAGDDVIVSGTGHDQINAGDGDDAIFSENGDDLIRAGSGNDTIDSGDGNDEVYGQEGNDNINAGLGDDIVFAGDGVDTINAGLGNDIVDAGDNDDLVLGSLGNDIIYGNSGNDDLYGEIGNDYIMGGTGDDEIGGGEGDDILEGNVGDDTLDGGAGNDLFIHNLGDGNTKITDESGLDIIRVFGVADNNNITFTQNGNDLEITFSENVGDKITIKDQFLDSNPRIESLRIDNNTEIDLTSLVFDVDQNATYNTSYYSDAIDDSELTEKYQNILEDSNNEVVYNSYSSWYTDNYDTNVLSQEIDYEQYNEVQIRSYKAKRSAFGGHYMVYYKYYESNLGGTFGNDKIVGSWWNENIFGGDGNDYLYGNDGNDTIFGGDDHDLIYLGSGNDNGYGQNGFDKIYGGEGNDTIEGNADNDTLYGEAGNDVIMGRSGDDLAFGGKGNDFLKGGIGHDILFGGDNSDNIEGEDGNDYLLGERGDDIISGGDGDDIIVGGDGNDILNGNSGNDTIKGGNGLDVIDGGEGNDIIDAGAGNDMVLDSAGNDQITLGDGKDIFMLDTTNGGTKTITDFNKNEDRIVLKNITADFSTLLVNANLLQEGNNVRFTYNNYNLILENTQISDIDQNNFITSIIGDELDNILNGDEYANAIFGLDGNDILNGNGGDDLLWGGNGADQLYGNAGDDILYYNIDSYWQGSRQVAGKWNIINRTPSTINADTGDVANLEDHTASQDLFDGGDGDDILIMSEQSDTILLDSALTQVTEFWNQISYEENNENGFGGAPIDIETIYAFGGDDIINLSSNTTVYGDVRIYGDGGNDTIWTNIGNDTIFGGDGNDDLQSGDGDDAIYGDSGNDIIIAGKGNDILHGGSGSDTLWGEWGNDTIYGGDGNDTLHGQSGDDVLSSGKGDDVVFGGMDGNDTYIFNAGDGNDIFKDIHHTGEDDAALNDKILFGDGISASDLILTRDGTDLIINFRNNSSDSIRVQYQFYYENNANDQQYHRIENLEFSDGSNIDLTKIKFFNDETQVWRGDSGNNNLIGTGDKDLIVGGEGDDIIDGNHGDDLLSGGIGSDTIYGGDGDDKIYGTEPDSSFYINFDSNINGINSSISGSLSGANIDISRIKIGDFNGDGLDDVYHVQGWGNTRTDKIHLSDGSGSFSVINGINSSISGFVDGANIDISRIKIGDFNGDGLDDIYYVNGWGSTRTDKIHLSNGNGSFSTINGINSSVSGWIGGASVDISRIKIGDFNGDNIDDIYYVDGYGGVKTDKIYLSNGSGSFSIIDGINSSISGSIGGAETDISRIKIQDFNGDGIDDIYHVQGWGSQLTDKVYLFDQDGSYVTVDGINTSISSSGATVDISRMKVGDFNGDGADDIYYVDGYGGAKTDKIYLSNDVLKTESENDLNSNDKLYGEEGNDNIFGGLGADILNGGSGSDSFDYSSLEDSSINAMDSIVDFDQGNDRIDLSKIEEDLSFDSFEFTVENGHTIIKDKNSDFAIDLTGAFNMNEDDFIF